MTLSLREYSCAIYLFIWFVYVYNFLKLPFCVAYEQGDRNILRDDSGHLKVADFGVSKLLTVKEDKPLSCLDTSCECSLSLLVLVFSIRLKAFLQYFDILLVFLISVD